MYRKVRKQQPSYPPNNENSKPGCSYEKGASTMARSNWESPTAQEDPSKLAENLQSLHLDYCLILDSNGPLVDRHREWLRKLNQEWKPNQPFAVDNHLNECYRLSANPYRTVLFLASNSSDYYQSKSNSLALYILKHFKNWELRNPNVKSISVPNDLKQLAFEVLLSQKCHAIIDMGFQVLHLAEKPEIFIENINVLISRKKYKEACWCVTILRLQHNFDFKQILIPLIFQDKMNLVEKYLDNCPLEQKQLVSYLDSLCSRDVVYDKLIESLQIPNVAKQKCHPKVFRKLAARLMKKYNVPPEMCPNVSQSQGIGALKYLLYTKYTEGNIDEENYGDLLKAAVGDDPYLQNELVISLLCYNDMSSAIKYALEYQLPFESLPESVQHAMENNPERILDSAPKDSCDENWDDACSDYHEFALPLSRLIIVDNLTQFTQFFDKLKGVDIVGIDAEWKMTMGLGQQEKLAVLQIATKDYVFIIDVVQLLKCLMEDAWQHFIKAIFCNPKILKLGFAIHGDLRMIKQTIPCTESLLEDSIEVLDLSILCDKINSKYPTIFPYQNISGGKKLSDWVHMCLGRPLNKGKQLSNWEKRPLKPSQLLYAAIDSYCLLEMYNVIKQQASMQGICLDSLVSEVCQRSKEKKQKRQQEEWLPRLKVQAEQMPPPPTNTNVKSPAELLVVVDTMLQGLGRQLRMCGVDVKILENHDNHDEAVKVAINEKRVILTSGSPFSKLNQYVPPGMCYNVPQAPPKEQAADVLKHFNVSVSTSDIFSRCQICNGSRYIVLHSSNLKSIWEEYNGRRGAASYLKDTNGIGEFAGGDLNLRTFTTDTGATLKLEPLHQSLFNRIDFFDICADCGKIYWVGVHWKRTQESLESLLQSS